MILADTLYPAFAVDAMLAVKALLDAPEHQAVLRELVGELEGTARDVAIREGWPKVEDYFPNIAIDLQTEDAPYAALNYTRECTVLLNIRASIKTPGGNEHPIIRQAVRYVGRLAATAKGILNAPQNAALRQVTSRGDVVFTANCGVTTFGFSHGGAVRAAQFAWEGKFWLPRPVDGAK